MIWQILGGRQNPVDDRLRHWHVAVFNAEGDYMFASKTLCCDDARGFNRWIISRFADVG